MQISSQHLSPSSAPERVRATRHDAGPRGPQHAGDATAARPARPEGTDDGRASQLARLDGFTDALLERLAMAAKDSGPESEKSFAEAEEWLRGGLARLRAGIENGTLQPSDIQRGVENAFQGAREILDEGRGPKAAEERSQESDGAVDIGATVRERFSGFADSVLARVEGLDLSSREAEMVAKATSEAFDQAVSRLDSALFDPQTGDPIDRGTFRTLFSEALASLQSQLSALFEHGGDGAGVIYDASRAAEGLRPSLGSVDVAG